MAFFLLPLFFACRSSYFQLTAFWKRDNLPNSHHSRTYTMLRIFTAVWQIQIWKIIAFLLLLLFSSLYLFASTTYNFIFFTFAYQMLYSCLYYSHHTWIRCFRINNEFFCLSFVFLMNSLENIFFHAIRCWETEGYERRYISNKIVLNT